MLGRPLLVGSLAFSVALTSFAACAPGESATDATDDGGKEASSSSSSGDGNTPSGDSAPSSDGAPTMTPPNLLKNGEFDQNCANWTPIAGEATLATVARTGAGSCRFCMGTHTEAVFEQKVDLTVKTGDKFAGEVWIQAAGAPSTLVSAGLVATSLAVSDDATENVYASGPAAPEEKWTKISTGLTSSRDRAALWMRLRLQQSGDPADAGGVICVYVDDAALRRAD